MRTEWEKSENAGVQSSNLFIKDTKGSKPGEAKCPYYRAYIKKMSPYI